MTIKELSEKELDALIARMESAIDNDISITKEDMKLWLEIGLSFAQLSEQLADNDVTKGRELTPLLLVYLMGLSGAFAR